MRKTLMVLAALTATLSGPPAQLTVQGVDGGYPMAITGTVIGGGGTVAVSNFPATQPVSIASMPSTPVSGTVACTESGTFTVQPGNTANTTPWLFDVSKVAGTNTVTGGVAGTLGIGGLAADGAAASGNPAQMAGVVVANGSISAKTAGNISRLSQDTQGRLLVRTEHPNGWTYSSGASSATALTAVQSSLAGASISYYVDDIDFYSSAAATTTADQALELKSCTTAACGGTCTIIWAASNPALGGASHSFMQPLKVAANTCLCWMDAVTGTKWVNVQGHTQAN